MDGVANQASFIAVDFTQSKGYLYLLAPSRQPQAALRLRVKSLPAGRQACNSALSHETFFARDNGVGGDGMQFYTLSAKVDMHTGAIWIVDDDTDDHEMVREVFKDLEWKNELVFLSSADEVLKKLSAVKHAPFIIICELNLPKKNGFQLRTAMLEKKSRKFHSVPFIYWSSAASEKQVIQAYNLRAHGFFIKES